MWKRLPSKFSNIYKLKLFYTTQQPHLTPPTPNKDRARQRLHRHIPHKNPRIQTHFLFKSLSRKAPMFIAVANKSVITPLRFYCGCLMARNSPWTRFPIPARTLPQTTSAEGCRNVFRARRIVRTSQCLYLFIVIVLRLLWHVARAFNVARASICRGSRFEGNARLLDGKCFGFPGIFSLGDLMVVLMLDVDLSWCLVWILL